MNQRGSADRPHKTRRLGSRAALLVGFGALLTLTAFIGFDSLETLEAFKANNAQIRGEFLYREHTLDQVRAGLYESQSILSEYLLDESDPNAQKALRVALESIRAETTANLKGCIESLHDDSRERFEHLAVQLGGYWSTIGSIFGVDVNTTAEKGISVRRKSVLQQHADVFALTNELSGLNDSDLKDAEQHITEVSAQFRQRLLIIVGVGLAFGVVLTVATIGYAGLLENRLEQKYEDSIRAQSELRQLSNRLVETEERERRAISRELHDEIGQSLSALLLDVQNLMEVSTEKEALQQGLQKIKVSAENCLDEVRNMSLLLRPSMLDDLGLVAALDWQAREVSKRTGMVVEIVEQGVSDNLPEQHKTCVYRIVQEALNNCSKHAHAKNVRVVVRQELQHLRLSIEDDGKGFEPRRMRGLGLLGMSERVNQLRGVLTVDSDPTRGTKLQIDLPLPAEQTYGKGYA
jgi:signal transduction histidine kinase